MLDVFRGRLTQRDRFLRAVERATIALFTVAFLLAVAKATLGSELTAAIFVAVLATAGCFGVATAIVKRGEL